MIDKLQYISHPLLHSSYWPIHTVILERTNERVPANRFLDIMRIFTEWRSKQKTFSEYILKYRLMNRVRANNYYKLHLREDWCPLSSRNLEEGANKEHWESCQRHEPKPFWESLCKDSTSYRVVEMGTHLVFHWKIPATHQYLSPDHDSLKAYHCAWAHSRSSSICLVNVDSSGNRESPFS